MDIMALEKHAELLQEYSTAHTTGAAPHLEAVARDTQSELERTFMLTGVVEGRLLELLVFAARPRLVIDIGTYSGYSALAMAAALPEGARVITCELSEEHADFAQRHIDASPYADRIELRRGPALDTLATLPGPFDFVFIDADKPNYLNYYEAALSKLSERGLIVVDNTLWGGSVVEGIDEHDNWTGLMRAFNDHVRDDPRVVSVMLTVRDGLTLIRRAEAIQGGTGPLASVPQAQPAPSR